MDWRFEGTPTEIAELRAVVAEIPDIQRELLANHDALSHADRGAHQQQIGAAVVRLVVADQLPRELDGVGLFQRGTTASGVGRISTGLGCPHLETDPDFLGLMVAFQTPRGERVDLLAINDPGAPTDTPEEFVALLAATAAAAGAGVPFGDVGQLDLGNLAAGQAKLFNALRKRLGIGRATAVFLHVARQTARTVLSSSAVQPYWTGVVEASGVHGKFSFVPHVKVNEHRALRPGERYMSDDWKARGSAGDIGFALNWIPFLSDKETPLRAPSRRWAETHATPVGSVTFLQATDPRQARLVNLLATYMGANPGNWIGVRDGAARPEFSGTSFAAARKIAYALSQETRGALPQQAYASFFTSGGTISDDLERELERRAANP
ncbi:MAG: hypothetical protein ACT4P7_15260 [Gemmatimonadaceae bacterium]